MVPAADLDRKLHQRLVLILGQIFQHLRTQNGVGVEDGGLFRRQVVGVEDAVVDSNFADVVEGRGRRDEVAVHSAQAVDVGLLAQTLQQDAGDALHPGEWWMLSLLWISVTWLRMPIMTWLFFSFR